MGSTKTVFAIVAAAVALAVPAAVALAATTTFTGNGTDDPVLEVQFTRHGGSHPYVADFRTLNMFFVCSDGLDGRGGVGLPDDVQMDIKDNGKFSFRETRELEGGIVDKINVKGRFQSKTKATGTTKETQTQGDLTCTARAAWEATR